MRFRTLFSFLFFFLAVVLFSSASLAKKPNKHKKSKKPHASHAANPKQGLLLNQRLVLTFDDGPNLTGTPKLLDILDQYGAKAIFFVNGSHFKTQSPTSEKARELLREIVRRGHFVGNHTVNHPFLCGKKGPEIAETEIVENERLIEEAILVKPYFFRTPFGAHCPSLTALFKKLHIDPVGWTVDPQDWKLRDRYKNLTALQEGLARLSRSQKPVIILMHDIHAESIETMPLFLEWLKTKPNLKIVHPIELAPNPKVLEDLRRLFLPIPKIFRPMLKPFQKQNPLHGPPPL